MGLISEFKTFAVRGNVVDLAVGVIVGAAFSKIVSSLVAHVITPPLGLLIGGVDFSELSVTLRRSSALEPAVTLDYGLFLQACFDFLIVAMAVFVAVRMLNRLRRREAAAPQLAPAPSREEVLLTEIRDALRERSDGRPGPPQAERPGAPPPDGRG